MDTGYQRGLYVTSVLLIIFSLSSCTLAICALLLGTNQFGYQEFLGLPFGYFVSGFFVFSALLAIAQAVYQFVVGCIGINRYDSIDQATVLFVNGIVVFVTSLVALVFMLFCMGGGAGSVNVLWNVIVLIISAIVSAVFMFCAGRIHGATRYPDVY